MTQTYVLRVVTNLGTTDVNVPYLPTTDYFMMDTSALQVLETAIDTVGGTTTVTVALSGSGSSQRVNVQYTSGTITSMDLQWTAAQTTLDEAVFGFTANTGNFGPGGPGFTATNLPMGLLPLTRPPTFDGRARQPVIGGITRSIAGQTRASRFALPLTERSLSFDLVPEANALDEYAAGTTTPYATFESMMVRSLTLGRPVHYIPDQGELTTYSVLRLANMPPNLGLERSQDGVRRWSWAADFVTDDEEP